MRAVTPYYRNYLAVSPGAGALYVGAVNAMARPSAEDIKFIPPEFHRWLGEWQEVTIDKEVLTAYENQPKSK